MGFKVRGYTREVPQEKVRDYSLFAISWGVPSMTAWARFVLRNSWPRCQILKSKS